MEGGRSRGEDGLSRRVHGRLTQRLRDAWPLAVRCQAFGSPLAWSPPVFSIRPRVCSRASSFEIWPWSAMPGGGRNLAVARCLAVWLRTRCSRFLGALGRWALQLPDREQHPHGAVREAHLEVAQGVDTGRTRWCCGASALALAAHGRPRPSPRRGARSSPSARLAAGAAACASGRRCGSRGSRGSPPRRPRPSAGPGAGCRATHARPRGPRR